MRVGDRRRDRRMTTERNLGERAEVPDLQIRTVSCDNERRLGEPHLRRDGLHLGVDESRGVEYNPRRVTTQGVGAERCIPKDVHGPTISRQ